MKTFTDLLASTYNDKFLFTPEIYRLNVTSDRLILDQLIQDGKVSFIHDDILSQLQELIKCLNPSKRIAEPDYPELIIQHLNGHNIDEYGIWIYYPWNRRLVHLLDEIEFIEVRTNRNQYKITKPERDSLLQKRIGIIGLSVGQSIALTICMERGCGELRLADFDVLELSNLNRIRTGLHTIGVLKVVAVAREIAEIDPFIKVKCYSEGLNEGNLDDFFLNGGPLDLLIDECDGLDMKIISRFKARELGIPVLMDTSDRGMLDVERFDLEPDRPILHGKVNDINPGNIKSLSNEDKIPIMLQMLGVNDISLRGKVSMIEVQQTINTWPQLASSVVLGGGVGADVSRRILLKQLHDSGRYYIDLENLICDKKIDTDQILNLPVNPFKPLKEMQMSNLAAEKNDLLPEPDLIPDIKTITQLVTAACAAPSTGNDQPWKWLYADGVLSLFHDQFRSFSFGDFNKIASFISFGAAFENLYLLALKLGIKARYSFQPAGDDKELVAKITFSSAGNLNGRSLADLSDSIIHRHTNRNPTVKNDLFPAEFDELKTVTESIAGANILFFTKNEDLQKLGKIIGACDRIRLLNPIGHHDFVHREMRWNNDEVLNTRDGIDVNTLGLTNSQLAALEILKDEKVISSIKNLNGGYALDGMAQKSIETACAMCIITLPNYNLRNYFDGGRAMERFWLAATKMGLSVHPMISPFYLFPRILHGNGEGLDEVSVKELTLLREKFVDLTGIGNNLSEVFIAKIGKAGVPQVKSLRLMLEDTLTLKQ